jgi:DNA-binding NarL/FixJ family response regulator
MTTLNCLMDEKTGASGPMTIRFLEKPRPPEGGMKKLTPRQQEILGLLAKGFYYKEIGAALGISPATVRAHLHSVYRKLEVKSRALAVIKLHEYSRQHQY